MKNVSLVLSLPSWVLVSKVVSVMRIEGNVSFCLMVRTMSKETLPFPLEIRSAFKLPLVTGRNESTQIIVKLLLTCFPLIVSAVILELVTFA